MFVTNSLTESMRSSIINRDGRFPSNILFLGAGSLLWKFRTICNARRPVDIPHNNRGCVESAFQKTDHCVWHSAYAVRIESFHFVYFHLLKMLTDVWIKSSFSFSTHTHLLFYIGCRCIACHIMWLHTYCAIYSILKIEWWLIIMLYGYHGVLNMFRHVCMTHTWKTMENPENHGFSMVLGVFSLVFMSHRHVTMNHTVHVDTPARLTGSTHSRRVHSCRCIVMSVDSTQQTSPFMPVYQSAGQSPLYLLLTCDHKTAFCTIVHHAVIKQRNIHRSESTSCMHWITVHVTGLSQQKPQRTST